MPCHANIEHPSLKILKFVSSTLLLKFVCHALKISNHTIYFKIFYIDVQLMFNFFWYTDSFVIIAFRSTQLNLSEKVVWSRIEKKSFGYLEFRALKLSNSAILSLRHICALQCTIILFGAHCQVLTYALIIYIFIFLYYFT